MPRSIQIGIGLGIVCLHNLLDGIVLTPESPRFTSWAVLHQRAIIELGGGMIAKTTYPVLPWIGVILVGYALGPWFGKQADPTQRVRRMALLGIGLVAGFVLLRFANVYGDKPWFHAETALRTAMSFLALTEYPASLLFLMPTLGFSALMLALFEKFQNHATMPRLAMLGGAPMFYYLLHLYVLRALYLIALAIYGPNNGTVFGFDHVSTIWVWVALLIGPLYLPTRWFARVKQQRKDVRWLKYL